MTEINFDAAGFIKIDLTAGQMTSVANDRLAALPSDVLAFLAPGEQLTDAAFSWGGQHGLHFAKSTGTSPAELEVSVLADHLGGTLAVLGLGNLSIEIHGSALLFRLTPSAKQFSEGGDALLCGFLSGFLRCLSPHMFEVIALGADGGDQIFWAGNPDASQRLSALVNQGLTPLDALSEMTGEDG